MELALENVESGAHRVEVSGWDSSNNFFVEKTMLHWSNGEREVSFQSPVRRGCVVFVRLLRPAFDCDNFPTAYQASGIESEPASGRTLVRLTRLRPRVPFKRVAQDFAFAEFK